uniref:Transmembrane protein n=1 Tax=Clandestinovirus TaxID=2831644 RepID=A0A8F8KM90_9VIRU|nr:transmembrane protein [Clandestinovirus]
MTTFVILMIIGFLSGYLFASFMYALQITDNRRRASRQRRQGTITTCVYYETRVDYLFFITEAVVWGLWSLFVTYVMYAGHQVIKHIANK